MPNDLPLVTACRRAGHRRGGRRGAGHLPAGGPSAASWAARLQASV